MLHAATVLSLVLLGYSLVWPKALVFEISIIGSNPITPAKVFRSKCIRL